MATTTRTDYGVRLPGGTVIRAEHLQAARDYIQGTDPDRERLQLVERTVLISEWDISYE